MKTTPVPLVGYGAHPRYPLVRLALQSDRTALLRNLWDAMEHHGVPCPILEEIIAVAAGLEGEALTAFLSEWVTVG